MDINDALNQIRNHPQIRDAGMVLVHLGLVRSFDLKGRTVISLDIKHDEERMEAIRSELLSRHGIIEITVRMNSGVLYPGEPIMLAAVAGETRDKVFPVLQELIDRLKKEASTKREVTG